MLRSDMHPQAATSALGEATDCSREVADGIVARVVPAPRPSTRGTVGRYHVLCGACADGLRRIRALNHYGGHWPLVHGEFEHVGSRVVADDVEVVLAFGDLSEVKLGSQDRLAVDLRASQNLAERRHDHRRAATENIVG